MSVTTDPLVSVQVKNQPRTPTIHEGVPFVGLDEGTFSIHLRSAFCVPVKAVVEVDGINVMTGNPISDLINEPGVVLDVGQKSEVPGWRIDKDEWARFLVAPSNNGYAQTRGGDPESVGSIRVHFIEGQQLNPTPITRGRVPRSVSIGFGTRRTVPFEDKPFRPIGVLTEETLFYGTTDDLNNLLVPPTSPEYCVPPENWLGNKKAQPGKKKE